MKLKELANPKLAAKKAKEEPKRSMGMIEMSNIAEEEAIDVTAHNDEMTIPDKIEEVKMSKEELDRYHNEKGGVVLEEQEFKRYQFYLDMLAAEQVFDASFPAIAHSTEEFAEIYKEREFLAKELERYRELNPNSLAHEFSDPEVGDFMEFLHTSYELNLEQNVHNFSTALANNPQKMDVFSKFVKILSSNPNFFNLQEVGTVFSHLPYQ